MAGKYGGTVLSGQIGNGNQEILFPGEQNICRLSMSVRE
jgi:hypothetical protein